MDAMSASGTNWARSSGLSRAGRSEAGTSPGTLVIDPDALHPKVTVMGYGAGDELLEQREVDPATLADLRERWPVLWVDVVGLGDVDTLRSIGVAFGMHDLALEDVVHAWQRPKCEPYDGQIFMVARMPPHDDGPDEQLSLLLGPGWVVTFQERPGDCFGVVRQRIRREGMRIRTSGSDYLAYALLDALTDSWFPVVDRCALQLEALEVRVMARPGPGFVEQLHGTRRELLDTLKLVRPLRELLSELAREEDDLITDATQIYLRDCADHVSLLVESAESQREVASGLLEMHLSFVSQHMNEIMKVLTIIGALFIPLSFIAGLYGMNFQDMPELAQPWAYPAVLTLMACTAGGMLLFFRSKGWIGARSRRR
ncbi:MAG: magnesium and cobalt transport protein CorA [Planctomycetota bacterium]|nr:MAG: magnesium and cobalt transport protein CorA [Planctomycetota bacterium]